MIKNQRTRLNTAWVWCSLLSLASMTHAASPTTPAAPSTATTESTTAPVVNGSIEGVWRTIDDRTGFAKALVKIQKNPDGQYQGMIVRILPRPEYTPKKTCQNCPQPFTNQPIEGLQVLWGLHEEGSNTKLTGGYIIDPLSGHIYNSKVSLSKDGRRLAMRGYTEMSALGRSQTWIREGDSATRP
jgi:uncharacterized protein (DUF2147 family)